MSHIWFSLHLTAIQSDRNFNTKETIYNIIIYMKCQVCSSHALNYLDNHQINCTNNYEIQKLIFDLHNNVNNKLSKSMYTELEYNTKYNYFIIIYKASYL